MEVRAIGLVWRATKSSRSDHDVWPEEVTYESTAKVCSGYVWSLGRTVTVSSTKLSGFMASYRRSQYCITISATVSCQLYKYLWLKTTCTQLAWRDAELGRETARLTNERVTSHAALFVVDQLYNRHTTAVYLHSIAIGRIRTCAVKRP